MSIVTETSVHERVANAFAIHLHHIFTNEETLEIYWKKHFPALPFDRTDKWNTILLRELQEIWNQHGPVVKVALTGADRLDILRFLCSLLDFNLFSQVMLNLQDWTLLRYRIGNAEADTKVLEEKWAGKSPSPFDPKAKMFKTAGNANLTDEQKSFNQDLSTLKSLKIIARATPFVSFRVTPKGSTPALADSCNLSMLGVGGDKYLQLPPNWRSYYFTWDVAPEIIQPVGGEFVVKGIDYPFTSKSGGDILNSALLSRKVASTIYSHLSRTDQKVILPRMNSVLLLTDQPEDTIRALVDEIAKPGTIVSDPWSITLTTGSRVV